MAAHADYLLRNCEGHVTISLPRLRPCAGEFPRPTHMTDREMVNWSVLPRCSRTGAWCFRPAKRQAADGLIRSLHDDPARAAHEPGGDTARVRAHAQPDAVGSWTKARASGRPAGQATSATAHSTSRERSAEDVSANSTLGYSMWKALGCGANR